MPRPSARLSPASSLIAMIRAAKPMLSNASASNMLPQCPFARNSAGSTRSTGASSRPSSASSGPKVPASDAAGHMARPFCTSAMAAGGMSRQSWRNGRGRLIRSLPSLPGFPGRPKRRASCSPLPISITTRRTTARAICGRSASVATCSMTARSICAGGAITYRARRALGDLLTGPLPGLLTILGVLSSLTLMAGALRATD